MKIMASDELKNKVAAALKVQPSELTADSGPKTIQNWDSLGHLKIISLLDDLTSGPIEAEDAEKIKRYSDIVAFCRRKGLVA